MAPPNPTNQILSERRGDQLQLRISIFRNMVRVEAFYTVYDIVIDIGSRILVRMIKPLLRVALPGLMTVAGGAAATGYLDAGLSRRWLRARHQGTERNDEK
jgi:hypothetical protein